MLFEKILVDNMLVMASAVIQHYGIKSFGTFQTFVKVRSNEQEIIQSNELERSLDYRDHELIEIDSLFQRTTLNFQSKNVVLAAQNFLQLFRDVADVLKEMSHYHSSLLLFTVGLAVLQNEPFLRLMYAEAFKMGGPVFVDNCIRGDLMVELLKAGGIINTDATNSLLFQFCDSSSSVSSVSIQDQFHSINATLCPTDQKLAFDLSVAVDNTSKLQEPLAGNFYILENPSATVLKETVTRLVKVHIASALIRILMSKNTVIG